MQKHGATPYLFFIELMLYWEGRVNAKFLEKQFGISRQQSSQYINEYKVTTTKSGHPKMVKLTQKVIHEQEAASTKSTENIPLSLRQKS